MPNAHLNRLHNVLEMEPWPTPNRNSVGFRFFLLLNATICDVHPKESVLCKRDARRDAMISAHIDSSRRVLIKRSLKKYVKNGC